MDESISRAGIERQTQRRDTRPCAEQTADGRCCRAQGAPPVRCDHREGWGRGGKEVGREGTCARLQLVHTAVQQTQHCKAILLQLKINFKRKYIKKNESVCRSTFKEKKDQWLLQQVLKQLSMWLCAHT